MNIQQSSASVEEWRPAAGFPSYLVSNWGRVASIVNTPIIMKPGRDGRGYATVVLSGRPKARTVRVHRLVLSAFVGPCPEGMEACHWDGNRMNNHIDNLRWDTHKANCGDRRRQRLLRQYADESPAFDLPIPLAT